VTHRDMTRMTDVEIASEIGDAKNEIEDRLGMSVTGWSYPFGGWNSSIKTALGGAGLSTAVTMIPRLLSSGQDPLLLPRIALHRMDRTENVAAALVGGKVRRQIEWAKSRLINGFAKGTAVRMLSQPT
ncbi:MAG: polysaccharide deacetylase family protein, partial [Candidatus Latescibacteria bacterium]|nr:polysaccharide deacetylase family protein [Candidatus Latescibacterota bacterium]